MARKSNITKVQPETSAIVPGWMTNDEQTGTEELTQYIIPPRLKIVQKQADSELLELFDPGDVIIVPSNTMICEMEKVRGKPTGKTRGFDFTPVFFFTEYCAWNPIQLKGQVPAVRERTFDHASPIAINAKNPALRIQQHPDYEDMKIRFVEHLNFLIFIQGLDEPVILSFSRAAHAAGRTFCSLIRLRKAPIFGCMFHADVVHKKNQQGDWWEIAVKNPDKDQWTEKALYETFKEAHADFVKAHQAAKIRPDYGDDQKTAEASTEY